VGRPKICPTNSKWQTAAILKKIDKLLNFSNGSTNLYAMLRAYARTLALRTLRLEMFKKSILNKSKMADCRHFEQEALLLQRDLATHLSVQILQLQNIQFQNDCNRQMTLKFIRLRSFWSIWVVWGLWVTQGHRKHRHLIEHI